MHNGISKALDGPRRKPNQLYDYISNWLKKAENVQHTEGMQITEPQSNAAGIWAISMLHAHIELSELNAIDVDGTICVTATHEDTMYTIERCYQSLDSAKRDLLRWIEGLETRNTTARGSHYLRQSQHNPTRDFNLRHMECNSYDDIARRPGAKGRAAGPGLSKKKTKSATASVEKQMMGTLRKKCQNFEKDRIMIKISKSVQANSQTPSQK